MSNPEPLLQGRSAEQTLQHARQAGPDAIRSLLLSCSQSLYDAWPALEHCSPLVFFARANSTAEVRMLLSELRVEPDRLPALPPRPETKPLSFSNTLEEDLLGAPRQRHAESVTPFANRATALYHACAASSGDSHLKTVQLLLEAKAHPGSRTLGSATPLMACSVSGGNPRTARLLLASRADLETTSRYNWTALSVAASLGRRDMVHALLDAGANLHHMTEDWHTAMHMGTDAAEYVVGKWLPLVEGWFGRARTRSSSEGSRSLSWHIGEYVWGEPLVYSPLSHLGNRPLAPDSAKVVEPAAARACCPIN